MGEVLKNQVKGEGKPLFHWQDFPGFPPLFSMHGYFFTLFLLFPSAQRAAPMSDGRLHAA